MPSPCRDDRCANFRCDGKTHRDLEGRKWGIGWAIEARKKTPRAE